MGLPGPAFCLCCNTYSAKDMKAVQVAWYVTSQQVASLEKAKKKKKKKGKNAAWEHMHDILPIRLHKRDMSLEVPLIPACFIPFLMLYMLYHYLFWSSLLYSAFLISVCSLLLFTSATGEFLSLFSFLWVLSATIPTTI